MTSGSLKGVLSGKAYNKSLFRLKSECEAIERLLVERFAEEENCPIADPAALLKITQYCNRQGLDDALIDPCTVTLIDKNHDYEQKVLCV